MKCPYKNIECPFVDTSGMDKIIDCEDCDNKKTVEENDWNEFMMGL